MSENCSEKPRKALIPITAPDKLVGSLRGKAYSCLLNRSFKNSDPPSELITLCFEIDHSAQITTASDRELCQPTLSTVASFEYELNCLNFLFACRAAGKLIDGRHLAALNFSQLGALEEHLANATRIQTLHGALSDS